MGVRAGCRCRLAVQVGWVRGCVCGITCFQKHGSAERFTKIVTTAGDEQVPPLRLPPRTPSDTCPPGAWSRASLVTTQGTGEVLNRPQVRRPQLSKDRADSALWVYTRSPTAGAVTVLLRTTRAASAGGTGHRLSLHFGFSNSLHGLSDGVTPPDTCGHRRLAGPARERGRGGRPPDRARDAGRRTHRCPRARPLLHLPVSRRHRKLRPSAPGS